MRLCVKGLRLVFTQDGDCGGFCGGRNAPADGADGTLHLIGKQFYAVSHKKPNQTPFILTTTLSNFDQD